MTPVELCQKRSDEMNEAHYNWLKFQVTLSAGMISVLVAFRTSAPPEIPWSVWLLRLGLLAFAATVLSGIIGLAGKSESARLAAEEIFFRLQTPNKKTTAIRIKVDPKIRLCQKATAWSFAAGVILLAAFGCMNL